MDDLDRVIKKYAGTPLCEMVSHKQAEYLGALAKRGAADALKAIGLNDPEAADDIRDIRDLLRGLRVMKKAAWTSAFTTFGRLAGLVLFLGCMSLFLKNGTLNELVALLKEVF